MNEKFFWYLSRGSGLVAAVLLVLTLVWGLLLTTRLVERRGLPAWLTDLHRYLGGLSVVFIAVHMAALLGDRYSRFSVAELFVPFASAARAGYERGPVAWGIAAWWCLLLVEVSSLVMRHLPRTTWRRLHLLSYPMAVMVGVHAATAGTDTSNRAVQVVSLVLFTGLTFMVVYRLLGGRPRTPRSVPRPAPPASEPPAAVR